MFKCIKFTALICVDLITGGKDRQGRRILTIPAGKTEDLSVNKLGDTLAYLTQVSRYMNNILILLQRRLIDPLICC